MIVRCKYKGEDMMKQRKLGINGPEVSAIGLGCMGMSEFYGKIDDAESKRVILTALRQGITMLDTADMYGYGHNEKLIGEVLQEWKEQVFIATKFGIVRQQGEYKRSINNSSEYIRVALERSLKNLKREVIDLYYIHRLDNSVQIEDTITALAKHVKEGKIRYIGISEASAKTIERAHAVHPITALQSEYSLITRHVEKEILPTLEKLGIGFVPYCPLGRGLLSCRLDREQINQEGDLRKYLPRTGDQYYDENQDAINKLKEFANLKGITPSQAALAWVL